MEAGCRKSNELSVRGGEAVRGKRGEDKRVLRFYAK